MILIVDNNSRYILQLCKRVKELGVRYILEDRNAPLREIEAHKYDGMILSGGSLDMDHKIYFEEIADDIACLLELRIPVLGVCLGHQIIGSAFGGRVEKSKRKIEGPENVYLLKQNKLFEGLQGTVRVVEHHNREVVRIPDMFELLAYSDSCAVEAMKHKHRPIFGVQFHPEVSGKTGKKVLINFLKVCGERVC